MISVVAGRWEGLENLGEDALMQLVPAVGATVERVGQFAVSEVKKTLSGTRSGRAYRVGGRTHIASAPGEPPAVLFGRLRQSIRYAFRWVGLMAEVDVGSDVVYARRLEFGGIDRRGVRILPRPYFEPTMLRIESEVERMFENFDVHAGGVQQQSNLQAALFGGAE